MSERTWSIGELAEEFDTTLRTIRFYEDRGLLAPERQGTTRVFHARDRIRLQLILRGKRLGFTLDEIGKRREALLAKRRDVNEALAELDDLEERCRADLERLSDSR